MAMSQGWSPQQQVLCIWLGKTLEPEGRKGRAKQLSICLIQPVRIHGVMPRQVAINRVGPAF